MSDDYSGAVGGERRHFERQGADASKRNGRRPPPARIDDRERELELRYGYGDLGDDELDYMAAQTPGLDEAHVTAAAAREHLREHPR